jgi:periplasmic copper chaperone A
MKSRAVAILLTLVIASMAAACSASSTSTSSVSAASTPPAGGPLTVKDVWVRAAPAGGQTAVYFTIVNGKVAPDALVGVSTPAATSAGLHETTTDNSGMTGMQPVGQITIPGGGTVELKPGGYHVMLMGLANELKVGDTIPLTLTFEQAGVVPITAEVRAS